MEPQREKAEIIWLESADSTNRALRQVMDRIDNLSVIAAREQTHGRGQGDHVWYSSPGLNLTFSMLFEFGDSCGSLPLPASDAGVVMQIATLGVRDYLVSRGIGNVRIKWPNDIWVADRKICGMLIENVIEDSKVVRSIAGIGVNVNETDWPEDLPNPVSMKQLAGYGYDPETELPELVGRLAARYMQASGEDGRKTLASEFSKYVFRLP